MVKCQSSSDSDQIDNLANKMTLTMPAPEVTEADVESDEFDA